MQTNFAKFCAILRKISSRMEWPLLTAGIIHKRNGKSKELYLDESTMLDRYNPNIPISVVEQFCRNTCVDLEK